MPDGKRRADPRAAGDGARGLRELGDVRGLAEPEVREGESLRQVAALTRGDAQTVLIGDVQRLAFGQAPVHTLLRARERALQLAHHGLQHRGVDLHARQPGELFGIDAGHVARHQATHELLELFFRVPVVVCHFFASQPGQGERDLR
ncbi:hypothetical protein QE388_002811 [Microbacterium sp. SORGH_AS 969]|nr:hypothetical protein [Microbacterium sp. SORGH_AS_0969]